MKNASGQDGIPFRKGKRLYLGPILKGDVPKITIWINDQETHQFLTIGYPMTPEDEEKWFAGLSERKSTDVVFAIRLTDTGEIIGVIGLHHIDHLNGTAVTGSYIGQKGLRGKGYGTEAKMLLLEYAFNTLNLRKIKAEVYDFNEASQKCLENCGYKPEGTFIRDKYRNGRYVDVHQVAVFKEDFLPLWEAYQKKYFGKTKRIRKK